MEQAKVNWNDDRLDHFAAQVDKRFEQVDKRFDKFEERVDARFDHLEARFDSLQHAMIVTLASFLAAFAGLVATMHL
jgi:flagellar capping protein FliD